jgi:hypothetical protein
MEEEVENPLEIENEKKPKKIYTLNKSHYLPPGVEMSEKNEEKDNGEEGKGEK